jgi:hypothetical protein
MDLSSHWHRHPGIRKGDELTRANPLQSAVVTKGLIKWVGNYVNSGNPDKINFLWIGEFFPGDPNFGGAPQRGFSLVRDDTRGGRSAIAMYDPQPNFGGTGLRQILIFASGDGQRLMEESRDGGQRWPQVPLDMNPIPESTTLWADTSSGTFATMYEGRVPIIGNRVQYRVWCQNEAATASEFRMRVSGSSGDLVGPTHVLAAGANAVFEDVVNVAVERGGTYDLRWEGRRTSGANKARAALIFARCYTP